MVNVDSNTPDGEPNRPSKYQKDLPTRQQNESDPDSSFQASLPNSSDERVTGSSLNAHTLAPQTQLDVTTAESFVSEGYSRLSSLLLLFSPAQFGGWLPLVGQSPWRDSYSAFRQEFYKVFSAADSLMDDLQDALAQKDFQRISGYVHEDLQHIINHAVLIVREMQSQNSEIYDMVEQYVKRKYQERDPSATEMELQQVISINIPCSKELATETIPNYLCDSLKRFSQDRVDLTESDINNEVLQLRFHGARHILFSQASPIVENMTNAEVRRHLIQSFVEFSKTYTVIHKKAFDHFQHEASIFESFANPMFESSREFNLVNQIFLESNPPLVVVGDAGVVSYSVETFPEAEKLWKEAWPEVVQRFSNLAASLDEKGGTLELNLQSNSYFVLKIRFGSVQRGITSSYEPCQERAALLDTLDHMGETGEKQIYLRRNLPDSSLHYRLQFDESGIRTEEGRKTILSQVLPLADRLKQLDANNAHGHAPLFNAVTVLIDSRQTQSLEEAYETGAIDVLSFQSEMSPEETEPDRECLSALVEKEFHWESPSKNPIAANPPKKGSQSYIQSMTSNARALYVALPMLEHQEIVHLIDQLHQRCIIHQLTLIPESYRFDSGVSDVELIKSVLASALHLVNENHNGEKLRLLAPNGLSKSLVNNEEFSAVTRFFLLRSEELVCVGNFDRRESAFRVRPHRQDYADEVAQRILSASTLSSIKGSQAAGQHFAKALLDGGVELPDVVLFPLGQVAAGFPLSWFADSSIERAIQYFLIRPDIVVHKDTKNDTFTLQYVPTSDLRLAVPES